MFLGAATKGRLKACCRLSLSNAALDISAPLRPFSAAIITFSVTAFADHIKTAQVEQ